MATSIDHLVRALRGFEARKELLKQLRKRIRQPVPAVRKAIRARALATLPRRGGLGRWAAAIRITVAIKTAGRSAGVKLKGGRNSQGGRSDMRALDARGRVRHPSWGRRFRGQWHTQQVEPGFVRVPVTQAREWRQAIDAAVADALETIRHG